MIFILMFPPLIFIGTPEIFSPFAPALGTPFQAAEQLSGSGRSGYGWGGGVWQAASWDVTISPCPATIIP